MQIDKIGYVAYVKVESDDEKVLMFVKEFDTVEEVEEFKSIYNRNNKITILVGIVHHHISLEHETLDELIVTPKNGDNCFHYSDMVDMDDVMKAVIGDMGDENV